MWEILEDINFRCFCGPEWNRENCYNENYLLDRCGFVSRRSSRFITRKTSKTHIRENCYPRKFPAIQCVCPIIPDKTQPKQAFIAMESREDLAAGLDKLCNYTCQHLDVRVPQCFQVHQTSKQPDRDITGASSLNQMTHAMPEFGSNFRRPAGSTCTVEPHYYSHLWARHCWLLYRGGYFTGVQMYWITLLGTWTRRL